MFNKMKRSVFDVEGVVVTIPYQYHNMYVYQLPSFPDDISPSEEGGFNLIRTVINLKLAKDQGLDERITTFDPPILLRVRYTYYDYQAAQEAGESLKLAFWNGKVWVRFDSAYNFHLIPDDPNAHELGGVGFAMISEWDDPHVAWGY
ncbi:MAG: hypothetical protein U9R58_01180 [Chloroflexota bacterium]|nr:hypothetical protein [Chloroflexota bacterium]